MTHCEMEKVSLALLRTVFDKFELLYNVDVRARVNSRDCVVNTT